MSSSNCSKPMIKIKILKVVQAQRTTLHRGAKLSMVAEFALTTVPSRGQWSNICEVLMDKTIINCKFYTQQKYPLKSEMEVFRHLKP
jgi:hypothetical protein